MPFVEDFTPFFNVAEFATAATVNGTPVNGIFDNSYFEPLGNTVEGLAPTFLFPTADVAVAHGQSVVIGATTYKIRGVEPDGTGVTLLRLEKQ